jgi:hypothetical protein
MHESKTARTTLRLDEHLMREVKASAVQSGRTLTDWIEDALREVLLRRRQSGKGERFELPVFNMGPPLPGVDLNNSAALLDLMEEGNGPV